MSGPFRLERDPISEAPRPSCAPFKICRNGPGTDCPSFPRGPYLRRGKEPQKELRLFNGRYKRCSRCRSAHQRSPDFLHRRSRKPACSLTPEGKKFSAAENENRMGRLRGQFPSCRLKCLSRYLPNLDPIHRPFSHV